MGRPYVASLVGRHNTYGYLSSLSIIKMVTVALFIITNVIGQVLKEVVFKKWGIIGVQATVFIIAMVGACVWYAALQNEGVMTALLRGVEIFTYAIAFYEVILKNINIGGYTIVTTKDID